MKNKKHLILIFVILLAVVLLRYFMLESSQEKGFLDVKVNSEAERPSEQIDHSDMGNTYNDDYDKAVSVSDKVNMDDEISHMKEEEKEDVDDSKDVVIIDTSYVDPSYVAYTIQVDNSDIYKLYDTCNIMYRRLNINGMLVSNVKVVAIKDSEGNRYEESSEVANRVSVAMPRDIYYMVLKANYTPNSRLVLYKSNGKDIKLTDNEIIINDIDNNSKFKVTN